MKISFAFVLQPLAVKGVFSKNNKKFGASAFRVGVNTSLLSFHYIAFDAIFPIYRCFKMSKLNSKLFKSKMNENGMTSEGGEGAGASGFKMGNVVQQCVEVDNNNSFDGQSKTFIF